MKLEELEALVAKHDALKAQGWRNDDEFAASLVVVRDRPPAGIKISTPFGHCHILNSQFKDGRVQTVFAVSRKQLVNTIKKMRAAL